MSLITVIVVLVVVGLILYLINRFIPMDANIKQLLNIVVIVILAIWLLRALGVFSYLGDVKL